MSNLSVASKLLNGGGVVPQIDLGSNQEEGSLGAVVTYLRYPLTEKEVLARARNESFSLLYRCIDLVFHNSVCTSASCGANRAYSTHYTLNVQYFIKTLYRTTPVRSQALKARVGARVGVSGSEGEGWGEGWGLRL